MNASSKNTSRIVRLFIILLILTMTLGLTSESKAQGGKLSKEDREAMVAATDTIAALRARVESLSLLIEDTVRLHSLVASMQSDATKSASAIVDLKTQIVGLNEAINVKQEKEAKMNELIAMQEEHIKKFGKPKRWGIGLSGGYGLAGQGFGAFIGPSIHYSIFNW